VVFAVLAGAMLCASSASATDVTLGQPNLSQFGETFTCGQAECPANETLTQLSSAGVDTAPAPGVITSWGLLGTKGRFELRVLERKGEFFVGAGTSEIVARTQNGQWQASTELPVTTGDRIGVDSLDVGGEMGIGATGEVGARIGTFTPIVEEGHAADDPGSFSGERLMLNAQEELTPLVTSVSPTSGTTAGGDTVTITGKYFDSARNVIFGTRPATSWSVDLSGEHITAKTPASPASTVEVHVSNLHSTSEPVAGDRYTFLAPGTTTGPTTSTPGQGGPATLRVSAFNEAASRWRLGSALPHISSAPVGTSFVFELNEPANLGLAFAHVLPGRRVNGRCVALSAANRSRPKCKRSVPAGSLPISAHAGRDKVGFQGRLSRTRKLTPGNYAATVTTRGAHAVRTLTRSLGFTILP
jgi:IPT/TIG domain